MTRLAVEAAREIDFDHHAGGDKVPVLLAPGWGANSRVWDYVLPYLLNAGHDVITIDARACGRSDKDFEDVSIDALGSDVVAVIDHLGLQRVALNGWSLGGAVVTDAAAKLGSRCAGLVLTCGAAPRYTNTKGWEFGLPAEGYDDMIAALDDDRVTFLRGLAASQAHVELDPAVIDWLFWIFNESGARAHDSLADLGRIDQREILSHITGPTLVIGGKHDQTVPPTIAEHQAATYPEATLVLLETGHLPFIEARKEYRSALISFLDRI